MSWFGEDPTIVDLVNELDGSGLTVYSLKALDYVVPGEWENSNNFDELMRKVTGETDEDFLAQVKDRVIALYKDESEGYQSAVSIYQRLDSADKLIGAAALANKAAESFSMLSFLGSITPKSDNAQTMDLLIKIIGELLAFIKTNGIPGDGIADFVKALGSYAGESKIRMAALICFDGILPLGPDFIQKVQSALQSTSEGQLAENSTFQKISSFVPVGNHLDFVKQAFSGVTNWINGFVSQNNISSDGIVKNLSKYVEIADNKLDYIAGFLDVSTNYFEHTGIQTVATQMIKRAVNEV